LSEAESAAEKLRAIAAEASTADLAAIDPLTARAQKIAPRDFRASIATAPRAKQEPLPPYKTFRGANDAKILVGRGAAHNDELTLHVAKPHDLWLHAKGQAGAHVVVPLTKGASCPPDVLVDAAHLAAHFSGARDEAVVEVAYVPKRYVRKPRGSAPGLVTLEREKVIVLRKEEARMRALLESEER
jgi:predicted ribosome quality control (RQC) complex YloA/Tae2 family protein